MVTTQHVIPSLAQVRVAGSFWLRRATSAPKARRENEEKLARKVRRASREILANQVCLGLRARRERKATRETKATKEILAPQRGPMSMRNR